jgi:hypothetical protein
MDSKREKIVSRKDGRVGERATLYSATHSPLVEPDVRISRTLCGAPHKMRYVVSRIMWRPAGNTR